MLHEKVYFKTANINLAATLHTLNFPIDGIFDHDDSEIVEFYFENIPELEKTVDDFWNRRLKIEPHSLLITRKELLDEIHRKKVAKKQSKGTPDDNL